MFTLKVHAVESGASLDPRDPLSIPSPSTSAPPSTSRSSGTPSGSSGTPTLSRESPRPSVVSEITVVEEEPTSGEGKAFERDSRRENVQRVGFSSGNPRVESCHGEVHLFRNTGQHPGSMAKLPAGRGVRLCVLAVPNYMTVSDYCRFCWPLLQHIQAIRVVRNDEMGDRYMVLMTLDSQDSADRFFRHFNGKAFSSLDAELCRVLFVAAVEFTGNEKDAATPPSGLTELPSCPVCLERLDQHISGILTTLCNHSFHSSCISNWTDSSCPVCRYGQETSTDSQCAVCGTQEDLWICLICGVVGCGRYREGHAVSHFAESQHCYSLELQTQRVWDYVGDNYVHRLIQSKTDGKLVELPAPLDEERGGGPGRGGEDERPGSRGGSQIGEWEDEERDSGGGGSRRGGDKFGRRREGDLEKVLVDSKMEAIAFEYNHLLTSQLESQRQYFEGLLASMRSEVDAAKTAGDRAATSAKFQRLEAQVTQLRKEQDFLRQLNDSLIQNQKELRAQMAAQEDREKAAVAQRDAKITDLEEQVRDLMVFIEAGKVVHQSGGDLQGASVVSVAPAPAPPPAKGKGARGGRRR